MPPNLPNPPPLAAPNVPHAPHAPHAPHVPNVPNVPHAPTAPTVAGPAAVGSTAPTARAAPVESTREVRLVRRPAARAAADDFALQTASLPAPADGDVVVELRWLAIDPVANERATNHRVGPIVALGACMPGRGIGRVVGGALPPGTLVAGEFGWRSHAVVPAAAVTTLPTDAGVPDTAWLGALGVPGVSAWIALEDVARVARGGTLVVTSAAGTVGAVAAQLAVAAGVRVVGIASGNDKCDWLRSRGIHAVDRLGRAETARTIGADHGGRDDVAPTTGLADALAAALPNGYDALLDLTGGALLQALLPHAATGARLVLVGHVGGYGATAAAIDADAVLYRRLAVQGFLVHDHAARHAAARAALLPLVRDGRVVVPETVYESLEQAPAALDALLAGRGIGRHLVRVAAATD